jgi:hypothetical protein
MSAAAPSGRGTRRSPNGNVVQNACNHQQKFKEEIIRKLSAENVA